MVKNIVWHEQKIGRNELESLMGHNSLCIWLTGLSGSGKSTLANAVQQRLHQQGIHTFLLDGDNLRHGLNADLTFTSEDRSENIRRVANVAKLFVNAGLVVIAALISPYEKDRQSAREIFQGGDFVEVYVECPLQECMKRDPKGLYEKARAGIIPDFTGVGSPYEPPKGPEIRVNTAKSSIDQGVGQILSYLQERLRIREAVR